MKQAMHQELEPVAVSNVTVVEGRPVIAGTSVSVEQILEKLRDDWFVEDIMRACNLNDIEILAAVEYAESLPPEHPLAQLLRQYRENLKRKVWAILAELKQSFQVIYGERLVQMVLFGSQARGDANPDSDIDVLVVLKEPIIWLTESERISQVVADLSLRYSELINCSLIDEDSFQHQNEPLLRNIRREGIAV